MQALIPLLPFVLALPLLAQQPAKPEKPKSPPAAEERAVEEEPVAEAQEPAPPKKLELGARPSGALTLSDIDGKPVKATQLMGKITVVNFYSIQCPIQAAWDGRLAAIQKEFADRGVVFLHIDSNYTEIGEKPPEASDDEKPYDNIRQHLKKKDLPFRVLVDHGNVVADLFQATTTPHVYVFGIDGRLVYRGLVDDDQRDRNPDDRENYLRDTLTTLLAGDKVEPFATKEVGCSIKRVGQKGGRGGRGRGGEGGGD